MATVRQIDIHFSPDAPFSPLADPAIGAAFANVEVAGEAAESLIRAVLRKVGAFVTSFGKVVEVTPQHYVKQPGVRGTRVDILVKSDSNEFVLFEIQVNYDRDLPLRNLLAFSHRLADSVPPGDLPKRAPKIIIINLLCYDLPGERLEYVQPSMLMYLLPPVEVADDHLMTINIQLPRFLDKGADFSEPLDCWLYTFYEAHKQGKTPEEVIEMTPELKEYAKTDPGFAQYSSRFGNIAANKETRDEYYMWLGELLHQHGIVEGAREEGEARGRAEGEAKGIQIGETRGIQIGEAKGRAAALDELLRAGMISEAQFNELTKRQGQ